MKIQGNGKIEGSDPIGFLSGSAEGEYIANTALSDWNWNINLHETVHFGQMKLNVFDMGLSEYGSYVSKQPPSEHSALCGDEFVTSATLGADLWISAVLQSRSKEEMERLKTTITVSAFWGAASSSTTRVDEHHELTTTRGCP